jgi:membrane-associated phospholipid phosphatase
MHKWLDWIGMYGPFLMIVIAVMHLYSRIKYAFWLLVCLYLNETINVFLKQTIREPRPTEITPYIRRPEYYGMPSGHAQNVFFIMVYSYIVEPSWGIMCLYFAISGITLLERYINKRHTIRQLIVGAIIGGVYAYICVSAITRLMVGNFENGG